MGARNLFLIVATATLGLTAAGCNEHLGRRDSVTTFAGDAKAANAAIHTIDPWPRVAENTQIGMDGEKAQRAMEKYYRGAEPPKPAGVPVVLTPAPAAPGAPKAD